MVATIAFAIAVIFLAVWFRDRAGMNRPAAIHLLVDASRRAREDEEPVVTALELGIVLTTAGAICLAGVVFTALPHAG